ncbi:hypothetical protein [Pseudomonas fulva]|uniref:hypothetical protein n=1 Tax=Pseudomonas fulva TaxID=47880 RepID=UPI0019816A1D|nr:hypothetical protein [Pseudomonas fulva]
MVIQFQIDGTWRLGLGVQRAKMFRDIYMPAWAPGAKKNEKNAPGDDGNLKFFGPLFIF